MKKLTQLAEWQALKNHHSVIASQTIANLFSQDLGRAQHFSIKFNDILVDYSKHLVTNETVALLCNLAKASGLTEKITELFSGKPINFTENRAVLHTALRNRSQQPVPVDGQDIMPEINATLAKMAAFTQQVRDQTWLGATGKPIRHIVNVGIGGSHLGPLMATTALNYLATDVLSCHFVSNIDGAHLDSVLKIINPETTLFIVSSKTFTTIETITNATTIRAWLQKKLNTDKLAQHFVAVTAAPKKAVAFGIPETQIFPFWDWVGGRYSVWSAIGLPIALMFGMEHFLEFLAGAHAMDQHFYTTEFSKNIPVLMGLLGIWYTNFFNAHSHAVIPYAQQLNYFPAHLQQVDMESNGKRVALDGETLDYLTGPIIFGEHGCDGQHAFYQLLHQSERFIPIDFILIALSDVGLQNHQDILVASCLSQSQALMQGKSYETAYAELVAQGMPEVAASLLAKHKVIPGNRPNTTLFLKQMTPYNLGALLALYEHKIFVQGAIWNINSFDQWGVELGKQLLPPIMQSLTNSASAVALDASTQNLIAWYSKLNKERMG